MDTLPTEAAQVVARFIDPIGRLGLNLQKLVVAYVKHKKIWFNIGLILPFQILVTTVYLNRV